MVKYKWLVIPIVTVTALALFALGLWVGRTFDGAEKARLMPSDEVLSAMKAQIDKDEAGYTDYEKFTQYPGMYREVPDRIWFKPADEENFYLFDPREADYEHILEVVEDRMYYSAAEDYNLYCFSPDSLETMATSGHRYVILDYNNVGLDRWAEDYEYNLIFNFGEDTRLYRLLRYLSYFKEPVPPEEEFTPVSGYSGYKYMQLRRPDPEYPKEENDIYWLNEQFGYKETTMVESLSITTDGGKTYQEAITKEKAVQIALKEAQKEKYKYQGPDCAFTKAGEDIDLIYWSDTHPSWWIDDWAAEDFNDHHTLWSVRLFNENDPLCSLYLYLDAFTGKVVGGGQLSD